MSMLDAFRVALRAILGSRLRSALTALGLIIGVSSVIVLIAVGQGTQKGVTDQIRGLGTDLIFVEPGVQAGTQGVPTGGARPARRGADDLRARAPFDRLALLRVLPHKVAQRLPPPEPRRVLPDAGLRHAELRAPP